MVLKQGALTQSELQAVWEGAVDKNYSQSLIAAGEGNGFEVYTQTFVQLARVSQAIDTTTQAMFILPHSAQTAPPAGGETKATVSLTFTRTKLLNFPLVLGEGSIFVGEQTTDWGDPSGVSVLTGRRYVLLEDVTFNPGDQGPVSVLCEAERVGWGYNNPQPGTIANISQPGSAFLHDRASVIPSGGLSGAPVGRVYLSTVNETDTFIPEHIGQYVIITAGLNTGQIAQIVYFEPPDTALTRGSRVQLQLTGSIESFSFPISPAPGSESFLDDEVVQFKTGSTVVGTGIIYSETVVGSHKRIHFALTTGTYSVGNTLLGFTSGATATIDIILSQTSFVSDSPGANGLGGASWRVLDWVLDWGVSVTNTLSPSGGQLGMLDALGRERNLPRLSAETDDVYRQRISQIADVVTPNAIRRAIARTLGSAAGCLREVGSALLPGIYYDRSGDETGDFYDDDVIVWTGAVTSGVFLVDPAMLGSSTKFFQEKLEHRDSANNVKSKGHFCALRLGGTELSMIRDYGTGVLATGDIIVGLSSGAVFTPSVLESITTPMTTRFHTYFDYNDYRAFFLVGVPKVGLGEFGYAYDTSQVGFYDSSPAVTFFDGFPADNGFFYKRIYGAIDKVRAGGVGFNLYLINEPCV